MTTVLALRGIGKRFFGVPVLSDIDVRFAAGEVHAVVGENGAGKSTMMKIIAGARGVPFAIEPLNRFEASFVNTVEQVLEVNQRVGSPALGIGLDTFHMNIEERDLPAAFRTAGEHLAHVQVCANDRGAPGRDHLGWRGIRAALRDARYGGPLRIESFTSENTTIATAAAIWRPLAVTQDAIAVDGLAFLRRLFDGDEGRRGDAARDRSKLMDEPLRVGIAGAGFIGRVHARSARLAGARLAGVAASTPERARAAAVDLGAERHFDSAEELVTSDAVDVVHVCTPNDLHLPLSEAALAAGKHVVCEKPLAVDASSAARLADAAVRSGLVASVPFVYRYHPMVREARARVAAGRLGALRLLHGSYLQDWLADEAAANWRVDARRGGRSRAFADIGSHWCDLVEFVSGHRIAALSAHTLTAVPTRPRGGRETFGGRAAGERVPVATEDAVTVQFTTDRGAGGSLVVSQVSLGRKNRLWFELDGADAAVAFDQEEPENLWVGGAAGHEILVRDPATLDPAAGAYATLPPGHAQGYHDCFDAFVAETYAALRGSPVREGLPTFADGLRAATITDAVLASAENRSWVEVPS